MINENKNETTTSLQLSHYHWREIQFGLEQAIDAYTKERAEIEADFGPDDEQLTECDDQLEVWRQILAQIMEELKHCERCRQRFEGLIYAGSRMLCDDCFEIEDSETSKP
jgi:hypothetical protein